MKIALSIHRQSDARPTGHIGSVGEVLPERPAVLNDQLAEHGESPVTFDSDYRKGICGTCG